MRLTAKAWSDYADRLSRLNTKAGQLMRAYLERYGAEDTSALISYASALVDKYGEGSAELACQMYDAMAEAAGLTLPAAEPAAPAAYGELAKAVNGTKHSPALLQSAVSRLVKQAGADTTLQNAIRDGAEFAWIPHGDTCAFCLMLASRGWQKAGKRTLKNGHAEHIHANCDCEYAVRFNASTTVAGYDPAQYLAAYESAEGRTYQEKLNSLRRAHYAENRKKITAQKRAAYLERKKWTEAPQGDIIDYSKAVFAGKKDITWHLNKHKADFEGWNEEQYLHRARELLQKPLQPGELEEVTRSDGSISRYCYSTNEFVATTSDGNIRTFFKPEPGKEYWDDEHTRN